MLNKTGWLVSLLLIGSSGLHSAEENKSPTKTPSPDSTNSAWSHDSGVDHVAKAMTSPFWTIDPYAMVPLPTAAVAVPVTAAPAITALIPYKNSLRRELNHLEAALNKEGYEFEMAASASPRARIQAFTKRIKEVEEVVEVLAENKLAESKAQQWYGETRPVMGRCVGSAHECFNLLKGLADNGVAQSAVGIATLAGLCYLRKKR